jgi:hypothetical protein
MAETTADVRRDIELTRERMSTTIAQLERKLNVAHIVRDHPWPALALAFGAGLALAASKSDVKAAAATVAATGGASSKMGALLDDVAARVITGATAAVNERIDGWVDELKAAIGAPTPSTARPSTQPIERQVPRTVSREPAGIHAASGGADRLGAMDASAPRIGPDGSAMR